MDAPNSGKSAIEQAICTARALMSYSPASCDQIVATESLIRKFEPGKCVRVITDSVERYIKVSLSGSTARSWSPDQLPEGETAVNTIDIRGQRPVTNAFTEFVKKYETQSVYTNVFQKVAFGERENLDYMQGYNESTSTHLRMSLAACASNYNEAKVREFREWLGSITENIKWGKFHIPLVLPEHLVSFSQDLAGLHAAYAADILLFGSLATAIDICINVAKDATAQDGPERIAVFTKLSISITTGDVYNPVLILNGVIQQAIDDEFVLPIMEIADVYRQKVNEGIFAAKSAKSIDEHLEKMYGLVPYAYGAHSIYACLVSNLTRLTPKQQKRVIGAELDTDEELVRLINIFPFQIMDFDGQIWNDTRNKIRAIRQEHGEDAARSEVTDIIDRHHRYPEILKSVLLAK